MAVTTPPRVHRPIPRTPVLWRPRAEERWRPRGGYLLIAVALVGLVVSIAVVVVLQGSGVRYQADLTSITPLDPSTVMVTMQVENLGSKAATPTCDIEVNSSAYAYTGTASIEPNHPLAAGSWATYYVEVPVTTDGATSVNLSSSSAMCR